MPSPPRNATDTTISGPAWEPPVLRVLASGSSGNCSVLEGGPAHNRRLCLIDAGLSPRKTRTLLEQIGRSLDQVDDLVVTHLDHDHFHAGWASGLPARALLRLHKRHLGRAERSGLLHRRTEPFDCAPAGSFHLPSIDAAFSPMIVSHDSLGVAVFRIEFPRFGCSLGFATDVGRVPVRLLEHLAGVDVLAIESNYCPDMQASSSRPKYLKRRIMDGGGHLSNQQCLDAIHEIGPKDHVVLLHLSRQCNRPELVAELHAGADYTALTITSQDEPSRWVKLPHRADANVRVVVPQMGLFA